MSAEKSSSGDYEIGYGKPPKRTRFKPGESGNPRGRPNGTKNLKSDLTEELGEKIVVREGEETRRVSKQRAVVKTLVAKTLKGDARSGSLLLGMMMRLLDTGEDAPEPSEPLNDDELEILAAFEERVLCGETHSAQTPEQPDRDKEDPS